MKNLRELRKKRGWSQAKLAQESGVSQTFISEIESDLKQPTIPIVKKLAAALGVTVAELLDEQAAAQETCATVENPKPAA